MKEINIGNLEFYNEIEIGDLQLDVKNVYPELEKVTVQSRKDEQLIKPTKYGFSEIAVKPIEINLEDKTVIPTKDSQEVTASDGNDGLNKVTIEKIPDEYIIPAGSVDITTNGTYDVTDKATANVNVPEKQLGTKTITANGTYKATDDSLDGYSEVNVETSGVDINNYFVTSPTITKENYLMNKLIKNIPMIDTSNVIKMNQMFYYYSSLETIPLLDTSNVTNMNQMFYYCTSLKTIPLLDTSNVTDMGSMFNSCKSLQEIPALNTSKVTNMGSMFYECSKLKQVSFSNTSALTNLNATFQRCKALEQVYIPETGKVTNGNGAFYVCSNLQTINKLDGSSLINISAMFSSCPKLANFGGIENLGKSYLTSASNNYMYYKLDLSDCTLLTHDSLMNVINGLYDIATKGCNTQQLVLGSTNLAKLTAEEIAIATEKGWTVS